MLPSPDFSNNSSSPIHSTLHFQEKEPILKAQTEHIFICYFAYWQPTVINQKIALLFEGSILKDDDVSLEKSHFEHISFLGKLFWNTMLMS